MRVERMMKNSTSAILLVCLALAVAFTEGSGELIQTRPTNITLLRGESDYLACSVDHSAGIEVRWYKDGKNVTLSKRVRMGTVSKRLYFLQSNDSDTGWYTCVARSKQAQDSAKAYVKVIGDGPPIITSHLENVTLHVAQEHYFACEGKGIPSPQYSWLFNGKEVTNDDKIQKMDDDALYFAHTDFEHAGKYTCVVSNKYGSSNSSFYITVLENPTVVKPPKDTVAMLGKSVDLECLLSAGWTDIKQKWYKDGRVLSKDSRVSSRINSHGTMILLSLRINKVGVDDQGSYMCSLSNSGGKVESSHAQLTVADPPAIHIKVPKVQTYKRRQATLECSSTGRPQPTLEWFIDGVKVNTSSELIKVRNLYNATNVLSVLEIRNTRVEDEGQITCKAINPYGTAERNITHFVIGEPEPPLNVVANWTSKTVVAVSWKEGHQGGDRPYFIVQYRIKDDPGRKWEEEIVEKGQHITYLSGDRDWVQYHIRVIAINKHSKSSPSEAVDVQDHHNFQSSAQHSSHPDTNTLIIILLIVGAICLMIIFAASMMVYFKHSRCDKAPSLGIASATFTVGSVGDDIDKTATPHYIEGGLRSSKEFLDPEMQDGYTTIPASKNWEIPPEALTMEEVIGVGNFGKVTKAVLRDKKNENQMVAVKMLKVGYSNKDLNDFMKELNLMKSLEPHPHVVSLVGCCTLSDNPLIVVEHLPNGNLLEYLQSKCTREYDINSKLPPCCRTLESKDLLSFGHQIAKGMTFLSKLRIVHRDLAARNVLLTKDNQCKISDFGLARDIYQDSLYLRTSMGHLPLRWMAYEAVFQGLSTIESDVWSYGIVLWEVVTLGAVPYPDMGRDQLLAALTQGYRMPRPYHCEQEIYDVMMECWDEEPMERPSFPDLAQTLYELMEMKKTQITLQKPGRPAYINSVDLPSTNDEEKPKAKTEVQAKKPAKNDTVNAV